MVQIMLFFAATNAATDSITHQQAFDTEQRWRSSSSWCDALPDHALIAVRQVFESKFEAEAILMILTADLSCFDRKVIDEDAESAKVSYAFNRKFEQAWQQSVMKHNQASKEKVQQILLETLRIADVLDLKHVLLAVCDLLTQEYDATFDSSIAFVRSHRMHADEDLLLGWAPA